MDERTGLPFLSDLIFIHIGTNLRCRDLVRLACSSARSVMSHVRIWGFSHSLIIIPVVAD